MQGNSAYYLAWLAAQETDLKGHGQRDALERMQANFENLRAAWEWAVEHENFDGLEQALESLRWYCAMRSRYIEGTAFYRLAYQKVVAQSRAEFGRLAHKITPSFTVSRGLLAMPMSRKN